MRHQDVTIIQKIAQEERRLAELDAERATIIARLDELRRELVSLQTPPQPTSTPSELTPSEKIALFRSLFKGREDVYPKMWLIKNGDRKG